MTLPPLVEPHATLSKEEISRYSRHILIPDIGLCGQQRLKTSKVLVIGAGGLGSPTLLYLAAAGVGHIGIIDFDRVEESNLQRQIIHGQSDVGLLKAESAQQSIQEVNPYTEVTIHTHRLDTSNALSLFAQYDLMIDGSDNFSTRYLVNDACVLTKKPYIWGSIFRFEGQASVFWDAAPDNKGVNYRDLYPESPPVEMAPSCAQAGVFGVLCGAIASVMTTEAIKLITGIGTSLLGTLLSYNALDMTYKHFKLRRATTRQPITELIDYEHFCGLQNTTGSALKESQKITVKDLHALRIDKQKLQIIDVREMEERHICCIEDTIHIPVRDLTHSQHLKMLEKSLLTVVHCKTGARSEKAVSLLINVGFSNVKNLVGGIKEWGQMIDPSLPSY